MIDAFGKFLPLRRVSQIPKVLYVGCLICRPGGRLLLQLRDAAPNVSSPGTLSAFGCRVQTGEALKEALQRELWEELRLEVKSEDLEYLTYIEHYDVHKRHVVEATYYYVELGRDWGCIEGHNKAVQEYAFEDIPSLANLGKVTREVLYRKELVDKIRNIGQSKPTLSTQERIDAIDACLENARYEANVYWQRNAIYVALNSIMLGGLAAISRDWAGHLALGLSSLGTVINWRWVHVNYYSKYLAQRWREDAKWIARSDPALRDALQALLGNPRIPEPDGPRPSQVMNRLSSIFRYIWLCIAIASALELTIRYTPVVIDYVQTVVK